MLEGILNRIGIKYKEIYKSHVVYTAGNFIL